MRKQWQNWVLQWKRKAHATRWIAGALGWSGRRDSNSRPFDPQSNALNQAALRPEKYWLNETVPYCTVFSVFCKPGEAFLAKETHLFRNASVKLGDSFFTTKNTNGHEKISWQAQHILAEKATSMKFFRVL